MKQQLQPSLQKNNYIITVSDILVFFTPHTELVPNTMKIYAKGHMLSYIMLPVVVIPFPCQHFVFHFLISYYSFQGLVLYLIMLRK